MFPARSTGPVWRRFVVAMGMMGLLAGVFLARYPTRGTVELSSNAAAAVPVASLLLPEPVGGAVAQNVTPGVDGRGGSAGPTNPAPAATPAGGDGTDYVLTNATLLKRTLSLLESRYLEAPNLQMPDLFVAGLEGLVRTTPDCLWVPGTDARPGALMVGRRVLLLDPSTVTSFELLGNTFARVFAFYLQSREIEGEDVDVEYAVIRGILGRLDRPTMLLVGNRLDEFKIRNRGAISGIGCTVGIRGDFPVILKIQEDGPSVAAGLKVGDKLLRIDGNATTNMTTSDVVARIRGQSGTWVVLDVQRGDDPTPLRLRIMRDRVKIENVEALRLDRDIGYVRISNFNDETLSNFRTRLARVAPHWQGLKGLVIDLRGNTGGSLKQSAYMVDEFVSQGTIVRTEGRNAQVVKDLVREIAARPGQLIPDIPLAVLVDARTASGAEILAGALRYLNRAVLIGQRTYGKGSVQQEYPLNKQASVKMTVARYLLPGDHFIHAIGIQPDITLVPVEFDKDQIYFRFRSSNRDDGEEEYQEIEGSTEPLTAPRVELYYNRPMKEPSDLLEEQVAGDFQVQFAAGLLTEVPVPTHDAMLAGGQSYLERTQAGCETELLKLFNERTLDWTAGHDTQGAQARVELRFEPPGELLRAGQEGALILEVTNEGIAPFHRLRAVSESGDGLLSNRQFFFGRVMPGETRSWRVPVKIPAYVASGVRQVKFNFMADGEVPAPTAAGVAIQSGSEPSLELEVSYQDQGPHGSTGDNNRAVEPGETVKILSRLRNVGSGPTGEVTLMLRNPARKELELKDARMVIQPLAPGESREVVLTFERLATPPEPSQDSNAPLQVTLQAADPTYNTRLERILDFGQPWSGWLKMVAPRVLLSSNLPLHTLTAEHILLAGQVQGQNGIRQLSIFRGRHKVQRLLPSLQSAQPVTSFPFQADIALLPGPNRLELVSEDEVGLKTYRQLWLRRESVGNP